MTTEMLVAILSAFTGAGGFIGLMKWWITRLDTKEKEEREADEKRRLEEIGRQDDLREELRSQLQHQIEAMKGTIAMQGKLISHYMSHIKVLEREMIKAGIEVPEMKPPVGMEDYV